MHIPSPATIPQMAPHLLARFQKMPSTSAGKNAEAASENAAPTRNRMFPGLYEVTHAAITATTSKRILETVTRRAVGAVGSIIL